MILTITFFAYSIMHQPPSSVKIHCPWGWWRGWMIRVYLNRCLRTLTITTSHTVSLIHLTTKAYNMPLPSHTHACTYTENALLRAHTHKHEQNTTFMIINCINCSHEVITKTLHPCNLTTARKLCQV